MADPPFFAGEIALTFLGDNIPAIGPRFADREEAVRTARRYLKEISQMAGGAGAEPLSIAFKRQGDGRYSLIMEGSRQLIGKLQDLDELLMKRFFKGLKKKLFILTCFVEGVDGLECLVLTEGLGAVLYAPCALKKWRP
jgi:hypothetical protein